MELRQRPRIGVMGPCMCSSHAVELARETGYQIAKRGGILICGGRGGVMEAAAEGAKKGGGITIGILPGNDISEANDFIDIPIVTGMGDARNAINILSSEVIIAVHGAYGTLSEIALALRRGIPVVGLETWTMIPPSGAEAPKIVTARTPEEAVATAFRLIYDS